MAEAFNNVANHLVSDSAAAINAGGDDSLSTIDADESVLARNGASAPVRRRRDDEDEDADLYDDDDMESLISQPVNGINGNIVSKPEEEVELPPHACAYVFPNVSVHIETDRTITTGTAAFITHPVL